MESDLVFEHAFRTHAIVRSVHYNRTILGYHGCSTSVAEEVLAGRTQFTPSGKDYDWLGPGVYFWEYGVDRAQRWADDKHGSGRGSVVGAIIHLGECFDLLDTRNTRDLAAGFNVFRKACASEKIKLPKNRGQDLKARYLDCAVIKSYLKYVAEVTKPPKSYDTVRGGFVEGDAAFRGSEIRAETHIQIAVRNLSCIVGVFRPTRTT